ncbi:MAG: hypothetical protein L0Y38_02750, partial [Methylococcaceae bacterium]|nr:hypothetical protein [Methylococcaceae bacterium]
RLSFISELIDCKAFKRSFQLAKKEILFVIVISNLELSSSHSTRLGTGAALYETSETLAHFLETNTFNPTWRSKP